MKQSLVPWNSHAQCVASQLKATSVAFSVEKWSHDNCCGVSPVECQRLGEHEEDPWYCPYFRMRESYSWTKLSVVSQVTMLTMNHGWMLNNCNMIKIFLCTLLSSFLSLFIWSGFTCTSWTDRSHNSGKWYQETKTFEVDNMNKGSSTKVQLS